jgi:AraC-like DNA-binding protein
MRSDLDKQWSVAQLARKVGMSRTLFAARFTGLVGHPPIRFLTKLRLSQSAGYLTTSNQTVYAIAQRVGYETEASFSKAFKREFGVSPGTYRRRSAERPVIIELEVAESSAPLANRPGGLNSGRMRTPPGTRDTSSTHGVPARTPRHGAGPKSTRSAPATRTDAFPGSI